ncbi:hypothetical protein [Paenibacillus prosopidis]|uniref:Tissue inhibitor of metalloproteinase n=1 Tax=Paenibacillus prosopidis TaxID=630520 RepID=A0A368VFQ3_9BACL|nr:hypothetical protein [Paenibacillus prosopidis]RCW39915.1 hypothetical protein DFP97_1453 [Paenibacillus prosopidis]
MKKRGLLVFVFGLFLTVSFGTKTHALSCVEVGGPHEQLDFFDAAVFGEVKKVKGDIKQERFIGTKEFVRNVLIDVKQSWKMEFNSQIIVSTDYTWGYDFQEGQSYLIYVYENEGILASSPCSTTYKMDDVSEASKLLGTDGLSPGKEVNLSYKMWFMTEIDFHIYYATGGVVLVTGLLIYLVKWKRTSS